MTPRSTPAPSPAGNLATLRAKRSVEHFLRQIDRRLLEERCARIHANAAAQRRAQERTIAGYRRAMWGAHDALRRLGHRAGSVESRLLRLRYALAETPGAEAIDPDVPRFRAHIDTVLRTHRITATYQAGVEAGYAWPTLHRVELPPIVDASTYATALHEIAHVISPCPGRATHPRVSGTGCPRCEVAAWEWAIAIAVTWTATMHADSAAALRTYRPAATGEDAAAIDQFVGPHGYRLARLRRAEKGTLTMTEHAKGDRSSEALTPEIRTSLRLLRAGATCDRCQQPAVVVRRANGRARALCAQHQAFAQLDDQIADLRATRERRAAR